MNVQSHQFPPANNQVFVNFRGEELRWGFVSHLVEALQRHGINVFIDKLERIGEDLTNLFTRIEESTIALVIFSRRYTESRWCLDELVKIKQRTDQGLLQVIPIFFKVEPITVKQLRGVFGDQFRDREWEYRCEKTRILRWKEALESVSCKIGLTFEKKSYESEFVRIILRLHGNSTTVPSFPVSSSLGRQCMNAHALVQEPVELSSEILLVQENSKIASNIVVVSKKYMDIETENSVLREELFELRERLHSLNSTIEMVEGVIGKIPTIPDFLINPWQIPYSSQPIIASAVIFYL